MKLCIIQARMGSTRLPGKVLRDVAGKTILKHITERLSPSEEINKLVVATTTNSEDDAIESFCSQNNIPCFRGNVMDVLDRFYQCSLLENAKDEDTIIRICCDNPLHSFRVMDFAIRQFTSLGLDYFSNSNHEPFYLEDGFDVEVTNFRTLKYAWQNAKLKSEREHVMPFIKNCGKFRLGWRKASEHYFFKLSVDTEEDLAAASRIFHELNPQADFSIDEVVKLLQLKPEILNINKNSIVNSGYQDSLRNDLKP